MSIKQVLICILVFIVGAGVGYFLPSVIDGYSKTQETTKSEETKTAENKFILKKDVATWLVWWDQDNGFKSLKENKDKINFVDPFWYQMWEDGTITKFSGSEDQEIIDFAKENKIKIIPVISNEFDKYSVETVIADEDLRKSHIENIMKLIRNNDYDGIEIDYEGLEGNKDRANFSQFMNELSIEVHKANKLLACAVHQKSKDEGTWEGPAAQDWTELAKVCDQIKIMAYDFHWSTSEAGDIAPLSWIKETLDYAVKIIPKNKIYLAVHFYGYDWVGEAAEGVTYTDAQRLIKRHKSEVKTSSNLEKYFKYNKDDESHTVYYTDSKTVEARLDYISEYDIAGVAIWRIGQEDPENWEVIELKLK